MTQGIKIYYSMNLSTTSGLHISNMLGIFKNKGPFSNQIKPLAVGDVYNLKWGRWLCQSSQAHRRCDDQCQCRSAFTLCWSPTARGSFFLFVVLYKRLLTLFYLFHQCFVLSLWSVNRDFNQYLSISKIQIIDIEKYFSILKIIFRYW